jgi:hypothetical protein
MLGLLYEPKQVELTISSSEHQLMDGLDMRIAPGAVHVGFLVYYALVYDPLGEQRANTHASGNSTSQA